MANDWIKVRGALFSAPKLILFARKLDEQPRFQEWLMPGASVARGAQHSRNAPLRASHHLRNEALRYIALSCAIRLWSTSREFGTFLGDDLLLTGLSLDDIDDVAGVPCVGMCMEMVGWARQTDEGVILPNFKQHNVPVSAAERMKKVRERSEIGVAQMLRASRNNRATGVAQMLRKNSLRAEQRREEKNQQTDQTDRTGFGESGKSADLIFRSSCESFARMLYEKTGSTSDNDPFLWQLAVLTDYGVIQEASLMESVESACLEKRRNPVGYLRRCLERHVGGKANLKAILARVRITKTFPRSRPERNHAIVTPMTRKLDDD